MLHRLTFGILAATALVAAGQDDAPEVPAPTKEHLFLKQFVGEWDCDGKAYFDPDQPPVEAKSTMVGRMVGDFWAVVDVRGTDGDPYQGQAKFGYDRQKKRYIGSWVDSMSEHLWRYDGSVSGNKLIVNSRGPSPEDPTKLIKSRDTWEFKSADVVVLTGELEGPEGKFRMFVQITCKRKK